MITTILSYWLAISIAIAYIAGAAWTQGYAYAKPDNDRFDAVVFGMFFPIYFLFGLLKPISDLGEKFFQVQQEKKVRIEIQEREHRSILESVDRELNLTPEHQIKS